MEARERVAGASRPHDGKRLCVVLFSIAFSVGFATLCSRWPGSDGRSAVALDLVNFALLGVYAVRSADRPILGLFLASGVFGAVELLADSLCVRCTGTLDYTVARSLMVLASPWWMPFSWALVTVQVGVPGDAAIRRFGFVRGMLLTGLLGSLLIPVYEEMAWGANWWRYQNCLRVGHTPLYIVVAEVVIGFGLSLVGYFALRVCSLRATVLLGVAAGAVTILGGVVGWGTVEFLWRGARPHWGRFEKLPLRSFDRETASSVESAVHPARKVRPGPST